MKLTAWRYSPEITAKVIFAIISTLVVTMAGPYAVPSASPPSVARFYCASSVLMIISHFFTRTGVFVPIAISLLLGPWVLEGPEPQRRLHAMSALLHIIAGVGYLIRLRFLQGSSSEDALDETRDSRPIWAFGLAVVVLIPFRTMSGVSTHRIGCYYACALMLLMLMLTKSLACRSLLALCVLAYGSGRVLPFNVAPYDWLLVAFAFAFALAVDVDRQKNRSPSLYVHMGLAVVITQMFVQNLSWLDRCLLHYPTLRYCAL